MLPYTRGNAKNSYISVSRERGLLCCILRVYRLFKECCCRLRVSFLSFANFVRTGLSDRNPQSCRAKPTVKGGSTWGPCLCRHSFCGDERLVLL